MIPHGNLKLNFCTSWPILFLLKNALVDKQLLNFKEEKYLEYLKDYASIKYVGEITELPEDSSDPKCAEYCIKHECDFITADKDAYDVIFAELKEVKSIEIIRILEKELACNDSPVYSLSFRIE